jgi:hypothetical protein
MGEVLYRDDNDELLIRHGDEAFVSCRAGEGHASVEVGSRSPQLVWLASHPLFTIPLIEMLKRRGLYSVHAAGVTLSGRALLFPGPSGSGKSTLTIALIRAGFGLLGDDMTFLARAQDDVRVLGFPDEVDLTDETVGFFPELSGLEECPPDEGWPKHRLHTEDRYGAPPVTCSVAGALVFPRLVKRLKNVATRIGPDEALRELAPNVLLTEPTSSQAHLDAMADLVRVSKCYRLEVGRDFVQLAHLCRTLIEAAA